MSNSMPTMLGVLIILLLGLVGLFSASQPVQDSSIEISTMDGLAKASNEVGPGIAISSIENSEGGVALWAGLENFTEPLHYHNHAELSYVLDGQVRVEFADGDEQLVGTGELIITKPEETWALHGSGTLLLFLPHASHGDRDVVWLGGQNAEPGAESLSQDRPEILHFEDKLSELEDQNGDGLKLTTLYENSMARLRLMRLDSRIELQENAYEHAMLTVLSGEAILLIDQVLRVISPGEIVHLTRRTPFVLQKTGDAHFDFLLYSQK